GLGGIAPADGSLAVGRDRRRLGRVRDRHRGDIRLRRVRAGPLRAHAHLRGRSGRRAELAGTARGLRSLRELTRRLRATRFFALNQCDACVVVARVAAERRILSRPETIRRGKSLWPMNISEWHGRCSTRTWVRNNNKGAYSAIRECGGLFSRRCHGSDAARRGRYLATR